MLMEADLAPSPPLRNASPTQRRLPLPTGMLRRLPGAGGFLRGSAGGIYQPLAALSPVPLPGAGEGGRKSLFLLHDFFASGEASRVAGFEPVMYPGPDTVALMAAARQLLLRGADGQSRQSCGSATVLDLCAGCGVQVGSGSLQGQGSRGWVRASVGLLPPPAAWVSGRLLADPHTDPHAGAIGRGGWRPSGGRGAVSARRGLCRFVWSNIPHSVTSDEPRMSPTVIPF